MTPTNDHEYAVLGGVDRTKIGQRLAILSSAVSGSLVFLLLQAVDFAKAMGWNVNVPPIVMSLIGAGGVYGVLFWILNKHAWKWWPFRAFLKVPHLAGTWACQGETLAIDGSVDRTWSAEITIVQCWDKLRVRLQRDQSSSNSVAASLTYDNVDGWLMLYHYRNTPKIDQPELKSHLGAVTVTFSKDLKSATAEYFTGVGRATLGKMTWTRRT